MRFLHVPDLNEIRLEVGKKITPALQRLKSLDLVCRPPTQRFVYRAQHDSQEGNGWRNGAAYLDVMSRRIRDTAGLHESSEFSLTE
jgi:nuclear pore complex protein Nup205